MKSFRMALLVCLAAMASMAFAGQASAAYYTWFSGSGLDWAGRYGPRHTLTNIQADAPYGYVACVNAMNENSSWAGSFVCATGVFNHPYCGCALRYPWIGAADSEPYPIIASGTEYW